MKSFIAIIIALAAIFQPCHAEIYKSTVSMKWSLYTPNPTLFSVAENFYFEKSVTQFLENEIRTSSIFKNQDLYMISYDVKKQDVDPANVLTAISAEMNILYAGTKQDDFATSLKNVISDGKAQRLLESLIKTGHFPETSTSSTVQFYDFGRAITVVAEDKNQTLFICLIGLVGVLSLTSFSIIVSSIRCCCLRRRNDNDQMDGIKPSNTMETETSPRNSPGKLGARRNILPDDAESVYAITPVRGAKGSRYPNTETPESQASHRTEASNASRNPLGIMRLNTLNNMSLGPHQSKSTKSMYQITLHESDDEESVIQK